MNRILMKTVVLFLFVLFLGNTAIAQIPKLISYQGFLTENNEPVNNGDYAITVRIFDAETAGNELWSETITVSTINGLFSTALGAVSPLDLAFDQAYFLSTTFDGTELLPRTTMTASPYAFNSIQAGNPFALDNADGSATEVVYVDENSNTGIGTNLPSTNLHVRSLPGVKNELFIEPGNWDFGGDEAQISFGDFNHRITARFGEGLNFYDVDQFRFINAGTTFEQRVGIGVDPDPSALLYVNGDIRVNDDSNIYGLDGLWGFNDLRLFGDDTVEDPSTGGDMIIKADGKVGIGIFEPAWKFQVRGTTSEFRVYGDDDDNLNGTNLVAGFFAKNTAGAVARFASEQSPAFVDIGTNVDGAFVIEHDDQEAFILSTDGNATFVGNITAANVTAPSDRRYKKDFTAIDQALNKVLQLDGLYYNWKVDEFPTKKFTKAQQMGFIAQDIEKLFPEMVHTDQAGYKSVNYGKLTPVLVEAIKEQQAQIDQLKAEKAAFQAELADLKANVMARLEALETQKGNSKNSASRTSERK